MFLTLLLQATDWALFLGRFHPVLVHLPIGFLLLAALLELGNRLGRISISQDVLRFILGWSALSAIFACGAGYLLSLGGGYEEELLEQHKWQGIGVAVWASVAWLVKSDFLANRVPVLTALYVPALGISTLLLLSTGHLGGGLTHGEEYLTQYTPEPLRSLAGMPPRETDSFEIKPIANIPEAVVYQDIVQPILNVHCIQCHNTTKQKGKLRMDSYEFLAKGGENGAIFVAGKSIDSQMLKRCLLPLEDDEHMPPKGKPQLSESQIALIGWWIDQGASATKKVAELAPTEAIKPALASLSTGGGAKAETAPSQSPIQKLDVKAPDASAVSALQQVQVLVVPLAKEQHLLEVSAINSPSFSDEQSKLLSPLSEQIVWLKLSDTRLTDAGMPEVAKLKNLNKLYLERTQISDAGLQQLKDVPYLELLNLIGTKVTDKGLLALSQHKALKQVYVWKSAVTEAGIEALKKARPDMSVVTGWDEKAVATFLKAGENATSDSLNISKK